MRFLSCVVILAARMLGRPWTKGWLLWLTGSADENRSNHHLGVLEEILVASHGFTGGDVKQIYSFSGDVEGSVGCNLRVATA